MKHKAALYLSLNKTDGRWTRTLTRSAKSATASCHRRSRCCSPWFCSCAWASRRPPIRPCTRRFALHSRRPPTTNNHRHRYRSMRLHQQEGHENGLRSLLATRERMLAEGLGKAEAQVRRLLRRLRSASASAAAAAAAAVAAAATASASAPGCFCCS